LVSFLKDDLKINRISAQMTTPRAKVLVPEYYDSGEFPFSVMEVTARFCRMMDHGFQKLRGLWSPEQITGGL
jgi:hypothetical protein